MLLATISHAGVVRVSLRDGHHSASTMTAAPSGANPAQPEKVSDHAVWTT